MFKLANYDQYCALSCSHTAHISSQAQQCRDPKPALPVTLEWLTSPARRPTHELLQRLTRSCNMCCFHRYYRNYVGSLRRLVASVGPFNTSALQRIAPCISKPDDQTSNDKPSDYHRGTRGKTLCFSYHIAAVMNNSRHAGLMSFLSFDKGC